MFELILGDQGLFQFCKVESGLVLDWGGGGGEFSKGCLKNYSETQKAYMISATLRFSVFRQ